MGIHSPWKKEIIGAKVASPAGECASMVQGTSDTLLPSTCPLEQFWEEAGKQRCLITLPAQGPCSCRSPPTPSVILPPHFSLTGTPSGKACQTLALQSDPAGFASLLWLNPAPLARMPAALGPGSSSAPFMLATQGLVQSSCPTQTHRVAEHRQE